MDNKLLMTTVEVGKALSVSRGTIGKLVNTGALKRVKIGSAARFPASSVQSYIASLETAN